MEKSTWNQQTVSATNPSIYTKRGESGFTYIEVIISIAISFILLPTLFVGVQTIEKEMKVLMGREHLRSEYQLFLQRVQDELKQGTGFRLEQGALLFETATGETIRYQWKKRKVIRHVKKMGEHSFQGTTILLQDTYLALFIPDTQGVEIHVGLQNGHLDLDFQTYIAGRRR